MVQCALCQFENEDGALFCEQCKSDLTLPESAVVAVPMPASELSGFTPVAAVAAQPVPFAAVAEAVAPALGALVAEAALAEAGPVAQVQVDGGSPALAPVAVALADPFPAASAAPQALAAAPAPPGTAPPGVQPRLVAVRGARMNVEYPLFPGENLIGRAHEKLVDIDLEDQESSDEPYCSREHARVTLENGMLTVEDLNSANHTYVNRTLLQRGEKRQLKEQDIIQIGTVWLKVKF